MDITENMDNAITSTFMGLLDDYESEFDLSDILQFDSTTVLQANSDSSSPSAYYYSTPSVSSSEGSLHTFKNSASRRLASRIGARRRRGSESRLLQDLAEVLAPTSGLDYGGKSLDKMTTLRLAVSQLKLRRILQSIGGGDNNGAPPPISRLEDTLGSSILLVMTVQGDIIYVSTSVSQSLGFTSYELIGRSIYEYCNTGDHADLYKLLSQGSLPRRSSALVRLRCSTRVARDPAHMRSDNYKVLNIEGRLFKTPGGGLDFFVGVLDPIPHPADGKLALGTWLDQQYFTSVETLDMKLISVDGNMFKFLGYSPSDYIGRTVFDFIHPEDSLDDKIHISSLYTKGQTQTDWFRVLIKGGGYCTVCTQKSTLNSNGVVSSKNRSIIVSRNYVLGVERGGGVVAEVQMVPGREIEGGCYGEGSSNLLALEGPGVNVKDEPTYPTPPPSIEEGPWAMENIEELVSMDTEPQLSELEEFLEGCLYSGNQNGDQTNVMAAPESALMETGVPEIDLEALPEFTRALDSFFDNDTVSTTTGRVSESSDSSSSHSPPTQILGKRSDTGHPPRRPVRVLKPRSEVLQQKVGSTKPIAIVSPELKPPVRPPRARESKSEVKYPTLTSLLKSSGNGGQSTLIQTAESKKHKSCHE